MAHVTIKKQRKDGKFPVRIAYLGAPNMFGGRDFPRVYNKLYTLERIQGIFEGYTVWTGEIDNQSGMPTELFTQGIPIKQEGY